MIEIDARFQPYDVDDVDAGTLLGLVAEDRVRDMAAARRQLRLAYRMVVLHPPTPTSPAAVIGDESFTPCECEDRFAGEGTPEVALFAVEDYSAAAGLTRPAAMGLIADAMDLVHRLPKLWKRIEELEVAPWKGRKVAQATRKLSYEAARWFDDHLGATGRCGWPTISKWLAYATAKFHPDQVKDPKAPRGKADWGVRVQHPNTGRGEGSDGIGGTSELLAVGDSLDLERFFDLITAEAERMKTEEGDTDTLDQRRAKAIGRLVDDTLGDAVGTGVGAGLGADGSMQTGLDLTSPDMTSPDLTSDVATDSHGAPADSAAATSSPAGSRSGDVKFPGAGTDAGAGAGLSRRRGLRVMVHLTLSDLLGLAGLNPDSSDTSATGAGDRPDDCVQRVASTDKLGQILVSQLRDWLARHGSIATVTPVIDMNHDEAVDRHDPPEWMAQQVRLRDQHCVYPECTRSAWDCDLDHITPYLPSEKGGLKRPRFDAAAV